MAKNFRPLDLSFVLKKGRHSNWNDIKELAHACRLGLLAVIGFFVLMIDWETTSLCIGGGLAVSWLALFASAVGRKRK